MNYLFNDKATKALQIYFIKEGEDLQHLCTQYQLDLSLLSNLFKGASQQVSTHLYGQETVFLVGLGKDPKPFEISKSVQSFFLSHKSKLNGDLSIFLKGFSADETEAISNALYLGGYVIGDLHKTKTPDADFYRANYAVEWVGGDQKDALIKGVKLAESQIAMLNLVNQPANFKYPALVAQYAAETAQKLGLKARILDKTACEKEGLEALLAVGKGSENEPHFIILEHIPAKPLKKICLVGKGVTFDTGGVSIKSSNGMSYMKSDMGGAAAVIGALEMAVKLDLPHHVIGIIPSCENSVDGLSIRPSYVINSYAKKTIEVIDTDAEGRLILADGIHYAVKNYQPDYLIDLATLTGSIIAAIGYEAAGLFTKNTELSASLMAAGEQSGEKLWPMPMWDSYADAMKSDIADIKNLSSAPVGGSITAAKFLEFFTESHTAWAHIDIAGTSFGDNEYGKMKSATAYGIKLLSQWMQNIN